MRVIVLYVKKGAFSGDLTNRGKKAIKKITALGLRRVMEIACVNK